VNSFDDAPPACRLVMLVGFMGSGKTSVGSRLAERLGWSFVDVDDEVETRTGSSIEALFRDMGEMGFREIEARITAELIEGKELVVATGGGWPAAGTGRLEALPDDVLTVWLRVDPDIAVERAAGAGRPLLDVEEPLERAKALLERREGAYRNARIHLDANEASPEALVEAIVRSVPTALT
jgi:shikimate kinase